MCVVCVCFVCMGGVLTLADTPLWTTNSGVEEAKERCEEIHKMDWE